MPEYREKPSVAASQTLSSAQFQDCVDRFGEDLDAWPADLRPQAHRLLFESADARKMLAHAREIRRLVKGAPLKAPPDLPERIIARAFETDRPTGDGRRK